MTPLAALALAVRDRLTAGAEAPLPGIGTLACAHVSARVRVAPDGRRVMLPPGESVGLLARTGDPTDLAQAVARHSGATPAAAAGALRAAVDQIDASLAITGDARLDGIGMFQRTSSGVRFAAAPELLAAVNRPYEGLVPVPLAPAAPQPAPVVAPAEPVAPLPDSPPGAVDILLDLIVNEPTETTPALELPSTPAQSAFVDDPRPVETAMAAQPVQTDAPPDLPGSDVDVLDTPEPVVASAERLEPTFDETHEASAEIVVPFSDVPLRDLLPPTPDEPDGWQPAPRADVGDGARPLDRPVMEDAEQVEDAQMTDWDDGSDGATPGLSPDLELAAMDASVAGGAEPPRTSEPSPLPDEIYHGDTPLLAPDVRSARRGWAFLYAATVLSLSALLLYWFIAERRPPVVSPTAAPQPAPPASARPAPLAADSASLDSLADNVLLADSLTAAPDPLAPAAGRP